MKLSHSVQEFDFNSNFHYFISVYRILLIKLSFIIKETSSNLGKNLMSLEHFKVGELLLNSRNTFFTPIVLKFTKNLVILD